MEIEASEIQHLDLETKIRCLRESIDKEGVNARVDKLKSAIKSIKVSLFP